MTPLLCCFGFPAAQATVIKAAEPKHAEPGRGLSKENHATGFQAQTQERNEALHGFQDLRVRCA
jgi:hypothetical protein